MDNKANRTFGDFVTMRNALSRFVNETMREPGRRFPYKVRYAADRSLRAISQLITPHFHEFDLSVLAAQQDPLVQALDAARAELGAKYGTLKGHQVVFEGADAEKKKAAYLEALEGLKKEHEEAFKLSDTLQEQYQITASAVVPEDSMPKRWSVPEAIMDAVQLEAHEWPVALYLQTGSFPGDNG